MALLLLALLGLAAAEDNDPPAQAELGPPVRATATWHTRVAVDLAREHEAEDRLEGLSSLQVEARWSTPRGGRVVLGAAGEYGLRWGSEAREQWTVWPDRVYLDRPVGGLRLRVGQQVARWGKLETTPLVDVLNPRDLRHGPLPPEGTLRVAVPMAMLEGGRPEVRWQAYVLPFHIPARLPLSGTDWALLPQGAGDALVGGSEDGSGQPSKLGSGLEVAARLAWSQARADGALMLALVREDLPVLALEDEQLTVDHPYTGMVGLDAATTAGPLGLRLESAAWTRRGLVTRGLSAAYSPELAAGIGVDWLTHSSVQVVLEGSWRHLLQVEAPLLAHEADEVLASALVTLSLLSGRVEVDLAVVIDPLRMEALATTELRWRPVDAWALSAGLVVFLAPEDTPRTLPALGAYEGGAMGLYADNDAWTVGLTGYFH